MMSNTMYEGITIGISLTPFQTILTLSMILIIIYILREQNFNNERAKENE